jgi:hypothetical protein
MSLERPARAVPFSDYVAKSTAVSALSGAAFVLLSAWAGLWGALLVAGMTCDDTCAGTQPPAGADWTQYSEAAQWTELGVLAGVNGVIALAATALVVFRHRRLAGGLVVLFAAVSVPLVALLSKAGQGPISYLWFVASALGASTVLAARRR